MNARADLVKAHAAKAAADRALEDAHAAALSARSHLDATISELAEHRRLAEAAASEFAEDLKAAFKSGGVTIADAPVLPELEAARIAVERRHDVAKRAFAGLEAELNEAKRTADAAQTRVDAAADKVVVETVEAAAARVLDLEQQAIEPRAIVGGELGLVATMRVPLSPTVLRVIRQNQDGGGPMTNSPEWHTAMRAAARLRAFRETLRRDPEAAL